MTHKQTSLLPLRKICTCAQAVCKLRQTKQRAFLPVVHRGTLACAWILLASISLDWHHSVFFA